MKNALSLIGVFLVAVMFSATGFAAEKYVSGNIGISWMNDTSFEPTYTFDGEDIVEEFDYGSGITLLGAFGCDYGDYRAEAELGYQTNDVEAYSSLYNGDTEDEGDLQGDVSVVSLMGNGYYDIDLGGIEFYLTAGVGAAQVSFNDIADADDDDVTYNESEMTLAYQLGAGFGIPVSDGIMLDARYRYFATTDFTLSSIGGFRGGAGNGNIESHSALLGLRVNL